MKKINFEDGTKVSGAKVTIDGVDYPVTPARYTGATPLSAYVMNKLQDNIENTIDQNANNIGGQDYDATSTYDVGDIVKYQGQLYICTTAITTAEAWNSNHWQATDVLSSAGGNEIAIGSASDITGKTKIFVEESTQRLKYKDSTTGQFANIAGDEVFIGNEEPVAGEKVWFRKGKNLFDKSKALLGYWIINEQGDIAKADNDVFVTNFIPVFKNVPVYIPATGTTRREFYNKNKEGITYLNNSSAQVFTPAEDGFIRVSCLTSTVTMDNLMIYYGSKATTYEAYIEPQIFVRNSNGVYEEFVKKSEESIPITDYTDLISSVEIDNFQKKQISSSIYGYKLQISLIGNFTKNTEYKVFNYPFSITRAGTIVMIDNTHQIGSYIINSLGFWVNFSEDITASTANKIPCTSMTEIGF